MVIHRFKFTDIQRKLVVLRGTYKVVALTIQQEELRFYTFYLGYVN